MKKEYEKRVEIFNKRLEILYEQICKWLEEEQIEYGRETTEMTLTKDKGKTFTSKRLDIYTKDGDTLFSVVPYGVRIVGAEGRVEIEGDSGSESLVYLAENGSPEAAKKEGEKEYIIHYKLNGSMKEGWHWVDERITGKRPLLTKDIFLALVKRVN